METPIYYASPLPWYRGRRMQTMTIRLLIAGAVACSAAMGFRLVQQVAFLCQQHLWMQYTMPADKIVFAAGVPAAASLATTPGYHTVMPNGDSVLGPAVASDPPQDVPSLSWASQCTCVFLHHLQAPGHHERLVSVVIDPRPPGGAAYTCELLALAQIPANLRPGAWPIFCNPSGNSGRIQLSAAHSLRLFAGQPDSADPSHFTIHCEIDGKTGMIDGWMMPDDTVQLQSR